MKGGMDKEIGTWFAKNCLTTLYTGHFFNIILKYGIKYCKSCNSSSNEIISVKFSRIVENSAINPEIMVIKSLSVVEKLHFVQWDIF